MRDLTLAQAAAQIERAVLADDPPLRFLTTVWRALRRTRRPGPRRAPRQRVRTLVVDVAWWTVTAAATALVGAWVVWVILTLAGVTAASA